MKITQELLHETERAVMDAEYSGEPLQIAKHVLSVLVPLVIRRCLRELGEVQDAHIMNNGGDPWFEHGDRAFVEAKNVLRKIMHEVEEEDV